MGEMFADTCTRKFPLMLMGGRAEGLACADPGARTPIGASGNFYQIFISLLSRCQEFQDCRDCIGNRIIMRRKQMTRIKITKQVKETRGN